MPAYLRGQQRDILTYVRANPRLLYGFSTKNFSTREGISEADMTALGHLTPAAANQVANAIRVFAANAPKPPRFRKRLANATTAQAATTNTFGSYNAIGTAEAAGWRLSKPGRAVILRRPSAAARSITAIAVLSDGTFYAFPMNKADFDSYGAALALLSSTQITTENERNALVSGSSYPKPGKAALKLGNGSTFSSFYSTAASLTSGSGETALAFSVQSRERVLTPPGAPPAPAE